VEAFPQPLSSLSISATFLQRLFYDLYRPTNRSPIVSSVVKVSSTLLTHALLISHNVEPCGSPSPFLVWIGDLSSLDFMPWHEIGISSYTGQDFFPNQ
jgi:hypothetical protein